MTVCYYEWLQNQRHGALERGRGEPPARARDQANYAHHPRHRPQPAAATAIHDCRPYCVGKEVDVRTAAMVLALKRIEAHYLLEGFSQ